jgi:hypothetical protein
VEKKIYEHFNPTSAGSSPKSETATKGGEDKKIAKKSAKKAE